MKSINQLREEFIRIMNDNGFEPTGEADYEGNAIFAREWQRECEVAWYGTRTFTYRITARISYGYPKIRLYKNGRELGQRDYSSPKRAINAIKNILNCEGYEL